MATRKIHMLSAKGVESVRKAGYHPDGGGLYLQVAPSGAKTWIFRYTRRSADGVVTRPEMGLGALHTLTLAQARETAMTCRNQVLLGQDPITEREKAKQVKRLEVATAITFKAAAEQYIESQKAAWKNAKHADQWTNTLTKYAFPVIGHLAVAAVDKGLVQRVLDPIWNTKTETASRLRGRIESVLDWAKSKGYRTGDNPAAWRGHLENVYPAPNKVKPVKHFPALPFAQIGDFMKALRAREGVAASAVEFGILTAARSGEVRGATWSEIDMESKTWTIPAARMKMKREHKVPLSGAAIAVLERMAKEKRGEFVFPSGKETKPLSDMTLSAVLKRMERADITVHGFRSTFRDWAAEKTNFANHVVEMALAHSIGDAVEAAYRRGDLFDKRRELMDTWAAYCGNQSAVVIPLRDSKRSKAA